MTRLSCLIALLIALGGASCAGPQADRTIVSSPDGKTKFQLAPDDAGRLKFSVASNDRALIESSPIAFTIDGVDIADATKIGKIDRYDVKEK